MRIADYIAEFNQIARSVRPSRRASVIVAIVNYGSFAILWLALILLSACRPDDPTFMLVCPSGVESPAPAFLYPAGDDTASTACASPAAVQWPSVPLRVQVAADAAAYAESVELAIDFWNDWAEHRYFVWAPTGPADVTVAMGSGAHAAVAYHSTAGGVLSATIELHSVGSTTAAYYVVAHELGHVLGLAHDADATESVMYPGLDVSTAVEPGQPFPRIFVTSRDCAALAGVYFP